MESNLKEKIDARKQIGKQVQDEVVVKKIEIDRRMSKMAQNNPLDFIEEVLARNSNSNK